MVPRSSDARGHNQARPPGVPEGTIRSYQYSAINDAVPDAVHNYLIERKLL